MEVKVLSIDEINNEVAGRIINLVNSNKNAILGLATGSTPVGVYKTLVKAYEDKKVSFKTIRSFNLDEYIGLQETNDQSYRYFMNTNLFDHIDIDKKNTRVPCGLGDVEKNAKDYDIAIDNAGGIDFQILGIGSDGHIAFNEPGTPFDEGTHIAKLTEMTIKDNSRFFEKIEDVPTTAITMGLKSIMKAKEIVLIATGLNKANAVKELVEGKMSEDWPCTILQKHPNVTIYVDKDAYSKVSK